MYCSYLQYAISVNNFEANSDKKQQGCDSDTDDC